METVKNTVFSLCVTAIIGSVLFHLLPKGSFQKLFRLIFCLFFLCSLTSPFIRNSFENRVGIKENEWEKKYIDIEGENIFTESEDFIEKELERKTRAFLEENGIVSNQIDVDIHISKDGNIFIERFSIVMEAKDALPELADKIEEIIGIKPEFQFGEEKNDEAI